MTKIKRRRRKSAAKERVEAWPLVDERRRGRKLNVGRRKNLVWTSTTSFYNRLGPP